MERFTVRFALKARFDLVEGGRVSHVDEAITSKNMKNLWKQIGQMFYLDGIEGLGDTSRDVLWIKDERGRLVYGKE